MAEGKKSFTAYCDWLDMFEELKDEEAGRLIKHLLRYVNDQKPEAPDRITELLFTPIKTTLKRDLKKWEAAKKKNSENAKKRWQKKDATACDRIQKDATASETMPTDAKHAVSVSVSVSDSGIENTLYYQREREFLSDWKFAREKMLNKPTNIKKLNPDERRNFLELMPAYEINYFRQAMTGLFSQKNMFDSNQLRPSHFLRDMNIEKYYHCSSNKIQLFEDKNKQQRL